MSHIPTHLQAEFDHQVRSPQVVSSRRYTAPVLLISMLFLFSDYIFLHDEFSHLVLIRSITLIICLSLLYVSRQTSLKWDFLIQAFSVCLFNSTIIYIGILAASYGNDTYQQGTILIIIYCCTLMQQPFYISLFTSAFCWLSYMLGIVLFSDTHITVVLNNAMVFATAAALCLMSVYQREHYLRIHFLQAKQLKQQKNDATQQALTDALTSLPNRFSLMKKLESYEGKVPSNMLLLMLDIDNFKQLNDNYGHQSGDVALKSVADELKKICNEQQGFLARYGGEEFIVFLENISLTHSYHVAGNLIQAVANIRIKELPTMTISAGAYLTHGKESSISECIELADQWLLKAKEQGKNKVLFFK